MASEQGGVSAANHLGASISEASVAAPATQPDRSKSLKRGRTDQSQMPTTLTSIANAGLGASPSPKSPRFSKDAFSPRYTPITLTGAAAMAEGRRKQAEDTEEERRLQQSGVSENPGHKALASLIAGGGAAMSKPQDSPVATTSMSEGMAVAANSISIPSPMQFGDRAETSPASITSLASLGSTAPTATAGSTVVASPASLTSAIEAENLEVRSEKVNQSLSLPEQQPSNRALSYPGNVIGQQSSSRAPPRGMSLPMPGHIQQIAPRSPSQKKHKCPYCETEFTRHHNLKSHLLTHSQEKPYVCQTCQMRFRRLHDLKRHMKLHTGERPHICPKCDRKFARGDALARHSKGQGGCAGRRASMGGFDGEDDFDDSNVDGDENAMDGIMYTNGTPRTEAEMTEDERRRFSLPSIKAQHVGADQGGGENRNAHSRTPSTYPPAGPRPGQSAGGLYPPNTDRTGSSSSGTTASMQNSATGGHTPTTNISLPIGTGPNSTYSHSGMTESPTPLSPAGMLSHQLGHDTSSINRQRSPSLTTQFQQQHFGRRPSGRSPPPGTSLTSSHGPKLPSLPGLDQRFTISSHASQQASPNGSQGAQQQHHPGSLASAAFPPQQGTPLVRGNFGGPSGHQQSSSNDSNANLFAQGDSRLLAHIQKLEDTVKQLHEQIQAMERNERSKDDQLKTLSEEVQSLRKQGFVPQPQQSAGAGPP